MKINRRAIEQTTCLWMGSFFCKSYLHCSISVHSIEFFPADAWKLEVYRKHVPACKFSFAEAHFETLLSAIDDLLTLAEALEFISLYSVDAPGLFARLHAQAALLRVYREHRELRFRQCTWNKKYLRRILSIGKKTMGILSSTEKLKVTLRLFDNCDCFEQPT